MMIIMMIPPNFIFRCNFLLLNRVFYNPIIIFLIAGIYLKYNCGSSNLQSIK